MSLWIPYFLATILMGIFSFNISKVPNSFQEKCDILRKSKKNRRLFICVTLILILLCAFKMIYASSIDEYAYRNRFDRYSYYSFFQMLDFCDGEYINGILVWLATRIFSSNQGIFIIFGTLTAVFYLLAIKKYSKDFSFGCILLMVTGIINTSFNITQQSLACAIFVYFCDLIYEKKLFKYILLIVCCYFIHKASIILLPLYWILQNKKETCLNYKITLISFVVMIMYNQISTISTFFPMLEQYSDIAEIGHEGVKLITIIINCVPAFVAFTYKKYLKQNDKITMLCANMTLVHLAIYVACIFDRYIARFSLFTMPFCIIFFSRCLNMFEPKSRTVFKVCTIVLYSIELYLRMKGAIYIFNFNF